MLRLLSGVLLLAVLLPVPAGAQTGPVDTLAQARAWREEGQLRQAERLLELWCTHHPEDANAYWLRAQTAFWRTNFRETRTYYQHALDLDPQNRYLKLDYIEALLNMGQLGLTARELKQCTPEEQADPYYRFIRAKWSFWSGAPAAAFKQAAAADSAGYTGAAALVREIEQVRSPHIQILGSYISDSQPLNRTEPVFQAGYWGSRFLDLHMALSPKWFNQETALMQVLMVEIGNNFHFPGIGTQLKIAAGLYHQSGFDRPGIVKLALQQRIVPGLQLFLSAEEQPYLFTRASLDTNVVYRQYAGALEWKHARGFWGKAGIQTDVFEDANQVTAYWAWLLSPPLRAGSLSARAGYAFSYSDALQSRYVSEKTLDEILQGPAAPIDGTYTPYFTPEQISIHLGLVVVDWAVTSRVSLNLEYKHGIAATAQNPFLQLKSGMGQGVRIVRDFRETTFKPLEAAVQLRLQLSDQAGLETYYRYIRNFFYEQRTAGAQLNLRF
ncbi:MAG: hypothetical protein EP344_05075 [Bacteroidetes bacterium]|nr:MAG: hypothetical protein EP344_05075 [Bacteroidota bacterium]